MNENEKTKKLENFIKKNHFINSDFLKNTVYLVINELHSIIYKY